MTGAFNRSRFKQLMVNIRTKEALDNVKLVHNLNSYNDAIQFLLDQSVK